jgi:hypothetical protein
MMATEITLTFVDGAKGIPVPHDPIAEGGMSEAGPAREGIMGVS